MFRRCRSHLLVFLALVAPIAMPAMAFAQDRAAPAGSSAQAPDRAPPAATAAPPGGTRGAPPAPRRPYASGCDGPRSSRPRPPGCPAAPAPSAPPVPARDGQDIAGAADQAAGHRRDRAPEPRGVQRRLVGPRAPGRRAPRVLPYARRAVREPRARPTLERLSGQRPAVPRAAPARPELPDLQRTTPERQPRAGPRANQTCYDESEASANMRLRLDPEIHISDNLRIVSEIFALDNVVLGSTPDAYAIQPATQSPTDANRRAIKVPAYQSAGYNPYAPIGVSSTTQGPPTAGVNSLQNSINVQRVWGEYMTPVGQLRFGRMPGQWGLGMVDEQRRRPRQRLPDDARPDHVRHRHQVDGPVLRRRVGLRLDGPDQRERLQPLRRASRTTSCNLCNVNEWAAFVAHKTNPEIQRLELVAGRPRRQRRPLHEVSLAGPGRRRRPGHRRRSR